jgi:hypothetical protein
MLAKYSCQSADEYTNALREILQEIALLGLWRGKFFEKAAFYGGTALRVLYGLDRFSEDMDFSLLAPDPHFDLTRYTGFIESEINAFGFVGEVKKKEKTAPGKVESAFLKANTRQHLLLIEAKEAIAKEIFHTQVLRIKIEVDIDPPPGFLTESRYPLQPIPFSVRVYSPSSLFAGKMHAVLCRSWKERVKGRDWYDLVWYVGRDIALHLSHLEARMRQSGDYEGEEPLTAEVLQGLISKRIDNLNVKMAAADISRFLTDPARVAVWSRHFFKDVAARIRFA